MINRAMPTLVWTALLASASALTLGRPDLTLAGQFFSGSYPSIDAAVAVVSLLCYLLVAVVAGLAILQALRAASDVQVAERRGWRAAMFLLTGVVVLAVSIAHRTNNHYSVCCGGHPQDIQEAASLAR